MIISFYDYFIFLFMIFFTKIGKEEVEKFIEGDLEIKERECNLLFHFHPGGY